MVTNESMYAAIRNQVKADRRSMRLREVAYHAIKSAILTGILDWEAHIIEERLGEVLELSRTPVREALAILEHEGLIESVPYKGLFVKKITLEDFHRMYEAAEVIEMALAGAAARCAGPEDIIAMEALLTVAEGCLSDDMVGYLAACREFQRRLGACVDNPYLTAMLISIEERSDLYLISTRRSLPPEKMLAAIADRRAILAAIRSRNPDAAVEAAQLHTRAIRSRWRDMYL